MSHWTVGGLRRDPRSPRGEGYEKSEVPATPCPETASGLGAASGRGTVRWRLRVETWQTRRWTKLLIQKSIAATPQRSVDPNTTNLGQRPHVPYSHHHPDAEGR